MDQDHQSASESRRESLAKKAASLGEDAQAKLAETAEPVKDKARSAAEEQKRAGADQVASLGAAVHGAAGELEKELPQAAGLVHSAAETLQQASSNLRERSIEDLASGFNDFARKQPVAAFAASILAGLALARFLKSSSVKHTE